MNNRLYIGNLSYDTTVQELRAEFQQYGQVRDVRLIMDRETGRARGFGFVEYDTTAEAEEAIQRLNGVSLGGRNLIVKEAEEKVQQPSGNYAGGSYVMRDRNYSPSNQGGMPDRSRRTNQSRRNRGDSDYG